MNNRRSPLCPARASLCALLALAVIGPLTPARADKIKANNATPLNDPTSWLSSATVPGPADMAIFNNTFSNASTLDLGDDSQSWLGIQILNPPTGITIANGHLLTLNAGGIDLSNTVRALFLFSDLSLATSQTWNTATTLIAGGSINLNASVLSIQGAGVTTLSGSVSGIGGSIAHVEAGSLTLFGPNSFTGGFSQLNGVTTLLSPSAVGTGTLSLSGGTLALAFSGSIPNAIAVAGIVSVSQTTSAITWAGTLSGSGTINLSLPTGSLTLANAPSVNSFTGAINLGSSNGFFRQSLNDHQMENAALDLGSASAQLVCTDSGTHALGALSGGPATSLQAGGASATTFLVGGLNTSTTFNGAILNATGSGSSTATLLTKTGTGTLTLTSTASTFSGTLSINAGTLSVPSLTSLGAATSSIVLGTPTTTGTLRYTGSSASLSRLLTINSTGVIDASGTPGALTLSAQGAVSWGTVNLPRTLTLSGDNSNLNTFAPRLLTNGNTGTVSLLKSGLGTWFLSASNSSFTGGTTIQSGLLLTSNLAGQPSLGSGPVTVQNTATFGGTGVTDGDITLQSGAHLAPGFPTANSGLGTLHPHNLSLNANAVLDFDFGPSSNDLIAFTAGAALTLANPVNINLFQAGTATPFSTPNTYTLFTGLNVSTNFFGSLSNFHVNHTDAASYAFSLLNTSTDGTSNILLTISGPVPPVSATWIGPTQGLWNASSNWQSAIPGAHAGDSATFGPAGAGGTVIVDGLERLGSLTISPGASNPYAFVGGGVAGELFLDNGSAPASLAVLSGAHSISPDIEIDSPTTFNLNTSSASLTLTGSLLNRTDGTLTPLSITGPGRLTLLNSKPFTNPVTIAPESTVQLGNGGAVGSLPGPITLNGHLILNRFGNVPLLSLIGTLSGTGTLTQASTGTLALSQSLPTFTGTLDLQAGRFLLTPSSNATLALSNLSIATLPGSTVPAATLDLTNNKLILQTNPALPGDKSTKLTTLRLALTSGLNAPNAPWTGPGLTSSTAAANPGLSVALVDNALLHKPTFGGVSTDDNSLLVTYALKGDTNLDGTVDFTDLTALLQSYNSPQSTRDWTQGNFSNTYSNATPTNFADLTALLQNYTHSLPGFGLEPDPLSPFTLHPSAFSPVPEPTSALLLLTGALTLLPRRRRGLAI